MLKKSSEIRNEQEKEYLKDFFEDFDFFHKNKFDILECIVFLSYKNFNAKDAIKPKSKKKY